MKKILTIIVFMLLGFILSSNSFSQDNTEKIKDGINKVYGMFNSGDFTGVENYIDAAYIEHQSKPGDKPGLEGLKNAIANLRKAFPDLKFTVIDVIITNDKAAVLNKMEGTNTGMFMGMPATGKKISVMGIDWLLFNNSPKCTEHWGYADDMGMMAQLGLMK